MKVLLLKIGSLALAAALAFCLIGCSANQADSSESDEQRETQAAQEEEQEAEEEQTPKYIVGDSVETPLVRFTLDRAELAIALDRSMTVGVGAPADGFAGGTFLLPKEYDATEDADNPFVASKGHTLVSLTFTFENLDRTSVELFQIENWRTIWVVYNGRSYGAELKLGAEAKGDSGWVDYKSSNIILPAGGSYSYKAYADIPVEIEPLNSPFEIKLNLPSNASETDPQMQNFTYTID